MREEGQGAGPEQASSNQDSPTSLSAPNKGLVQAALSFLVEVELDKMTSEWYSKVEKNSNIVYSDLRSFQKQLQIKMGPEIREFDYKEVERCCGCEEAVAQRVWAGRSSQGCLGIGSHAVAGEGGRLHGPCGRRQASVVKQWGVSR